MAMQLRDSILSALACSVLGFGTFPPEYEKMVAKDTYLPDYENLIATMYPTGEVPLPECLAPETAPRKKGAHVQVPDECCTAPGEAPHMIAALSALLPFRPSVSCPALAFGATYKGMVYLGCDGEQMTFAEKCYTSWQIPEGKGSPEQLEALSSNADSPETCGPTGCDFKMVHDMSTGPGCYRIAMMDDVGGFMAGDPEFSDLTGFGEFDHNLEWAAEYKNDPTKAFVRTTGRCVKNPWAKYLDEPKDPAMSAEKLAFIEWLNAFIAGAKFMGDRAETGYANCRHIMRHAYAPGALLHPWEGDKWGTPYNSSTPAFDGAPFGELPYMDCVLFGSVEHHDWAAGVYAVADLEYCPIQGQPGYGIWKGTFAPFKDASNVAIDAPPHVLETLSRGFFIKGYVSDEGIMTATEDSTCFGGPCPLDKISYANEWTC